MTSADGVSRRLGPLVVREVSVGGMDNRAYLLTDPVAGQSVLVDAAAEPERLLALVAEAGGELSTVVTTHRHPDHTGALAAVVAATGARTAAGSPDADALPVAVDVRLDHGDTVAVGSVALEVIALRGHTPGSVALLLRAAPAGPDGADGRDGRDGAEGAGGAGGSGGGRPVALFTGDSLFPGGPGRTTSPADFTSLMDDLEQRVFDHLGDEVAVRPGHGEPTTLGAERPHLGAWRARGW